MLVGLTFGGVDVIGLTVDILLSAEGITGSEVIFATKELEAFAAGAFVVIGTVDDVGMALGNADDDTTGGFMDEVGTIGVGVGVGVGDGELAGCAAKVLLATHPL